MKAEVWDNVIPDADEALRAWVAQIVGERASVSLAPLTAAAPAQPAAAEVRLALLGFAASPPHRGQRAAPLQFQNRYLVTVVAETPEAEHRLMSRLLIAALEQREAEVDLSAPAPELWLALGVSPRPSFFLDVPVRVEREQVSAPPVLHPAIVRERPLVAFAGRVLGPGDRPLAGALVKNTTLNTTTRTDGEGQFRFPAVPAGDATSSLSLTVLAKGASRSFSVRPAEGRGEPVLLRFAMKED